MSEPGTRIVAEIEHERVIDGTPVRVVEIHWHGTAGLSFDVYAAGECLTEDESLDEMPSDDELRALIAPVLECKFCGEQRRVYRYHRGTPVCEGCWDDRLEATN